MPLRRALGYCWAAPCSLAGLLAGLPLLVAGGRARRVEGALEIAARPAPGPSRLRFHAITLGHVILGTDPVTLARLRAHEQVHVRQYMRWGPLFFVAYPAASAWLWLRGGRAYRDNPFEVQARREAGEVDGSRPVPARARRDRPARAH